ncbi:hypothetical protein C9374_003968 [Naegleria lovaniensis]|uniref:Guanylate cyclase domain-containing protein n=1 Tax=Naegleria lovaniensis TaxID=51637 RepID=A0AA88H6J4_NAELO|nr:uncharacterized protein C9374_003968 [Naegleria lovaniensis]KAG2394204.1 hypothetical protein C9374_003968 [Naegleria lovaniensis]
MGKQKVHPQDHDEDDHHHQHDQPLESVLSSSSLLPSSQNKSKKDRPLVLSTLLSVRLFLIVVITLLVVFTALSIWLAAYLVNEQTALESLNVLISNMNQKVEYFINGELKPMMSLAKELADDYNYNYIDANDNITNYMFAKINTYNLSIITLCFAEQGNDHLYGYGRETDNSLYYVRKRQQDSFLLKFPVDNVTGVINPTFNLKVPYAVGKTLFYRESKAYLNLYPNGFFGSVSKLPAGGPQTFYFSSYVYNRTSTMSNSNKTFAGVAKINLTLAAIAQFLQTLKVLEKGYIILSEYASDYILGSSLNIPELEFVRVVATNVTTRNAGAVFKKLLQASNATTPIITTIEEQGQRYIVSSSPYILSNLQWRMTLVFDEAEIKKGIITSSYVILGVSLGVGLCGVVMSIVLGWIITNPFVKLQQDFKKIEVLDLMNIKPRSSVFTESRRIYLSLTETVQWLSEFRAFLPDYVLNQLQASSSEQFSEEEPTKEVPTNARTEKVTSPQESMYSKKEVPSERESSLKGAESNLSFKRPHDNKPQVDVNLFKLGLSLKPCCVVHILVNFGAMAEGRISSEDVEIFQGMISKLISGISTTCKTVRGDLQIKFYNEYQVVFSDKNCTVTALETCLKLLTQLSSLNDQLAKTQQSSISVHIGLASGDALQGNVGTTQMRHFVTVGNVVNRAKTMSLIGQERGCSVVIDNVSFRANKDSYVCRPIDRYCENTTSNQQDSSSISTVYELIKKNVIHGDEWFYELEQQKENSKFEKYGEMFTRLFEKNHANGSLQFSEVTEVRDYLAENNHDRVTRNLLQLVEQACYQNNASVLSSYYCNVGNGIVKQ